MKTVAPLCFIDTETTGVHPGRKVWEIAMIRRNPGQPDRERTFYVDVDLTDADPFGLAVGRFYERHPLGRWMASAGGTINRPAGRDMGSHLSLRAAAEEVALYTHGTHLVGAVPNFDAETLAPLLRDHQLTPSWHYHLVDVEALAAGYLAARQPASTSPAPPWNSDELTVAIGVEPASDTERHTAMGDAQWAKRTYDAIIGTHA
ncbi:hypothetical protein [Kribbella sp. CA-293567]|uniref:hypothetical protein n=1 Tax=Kribbella sp. CA-293567 TaxID=3002436 RepID=UPI0022DD159D|nr:hypothetical protein [Kribbella sp. CA-293567]WBQ03001.1 hypothetical protein OX958_23825 [Kribbella sp. CA-293567]